MRRLTLVNWLAVGIVGLATVAGAATLQLVPGTTDLGTRLRVQGTVSGLSATDATVRVRAVGRAEVTCVNPAGNEPGGQNRNGTVRVTVNSVERIDASDISGGTASFDVTTRVPKLSPTEAGCPGSNWTVRVNDVNFTRVTVRVLQGGTVVAQSTVDLGS